MDCTSACSRVKEQFILGLVLIFLHIILNTGVSGVFCPFLTLPTTTNRSSDATHVGAQVTWSCIDLSDSFNDDSSILHVSCHSDGTWNPQPHACRPRGCGPSPLVNHASESTKDTTANSLQVYKCLFGFVFPDKAVSKTLLCNPFSLEWDDVIGQDPVLGNITCEQMYCLDLPEEKENVYFEGDRHWENGTGLPVDYYINGYCKDGYQKDGQVFQSARCGAARRYDVTFQQCSPMTCDLYSIANTTRSNNNNQYRLRTKWSCLPNTKFPAGVTEIQATCNNVGQWSIEPPTSGCTEGACDPGWLLFEQNCYLVSDIEGFGLRYWAAEESCVYKKASLVTITNADENTWLYKRTSGLGRDFWIGYYRLSRGSEEWNWNSGSNTTYNKWWRGYPEIYNCARISVNGVWKDRDCDDSLPYICKKPAKCSNLPTIVNGGPAEVVVGSMDVGDSVLFECDNGYSFSTDGSTTRLVTCMDGAYFSAIENCQRTRCPPINRIGYHVRNAMPDTEENTFLTNVTWTCRSGFIYPDGSYSKSMMCKMDRTWTPTPPMCIKAKCQLPAAQNADAKYSSDQIALGDIYTCHRGYEFPDGTAQKNFVCNTEGKWEPQADCQRKPCDKLLTLQINGEVTNSTSVDPDFQRFGDMLEVTCEPGFRFPGGETVKNTECGDNYQWNPYFPSCEPLSCPGPEPPDVLNATTNTSVNIVQTVVLYTCVEDLVFKSGANTQIAFCDGKTLEWINIPLSCDEAIPDGPQMGVPTNISTLVGTLAIILFVFLIFFSICAVCHEGRKQFGICQIDCEPKETEDIDEEEEIRTQEMHGERRFTMVA